MDWKGSYTYTPSLYDSTDYTTPPIIFLNDPVSSPVSGFNLKSCFFTWPLGHLEVGFIKSLPASLERASWTCESRNDSLMGRHRVISRVEHLAAVWQAA